MRKVGLILLILLALACTTPITQTPATPTSTWARYEAIAVVQTWLAEQVVQDDNSCLDYYSHHTWTAEPFADGGWAVEAVPSYGDRTGSWYAYETTGSIARGNDNVRGC